MTISDAKIEELRWLLSKATKLPWFWNSYSGVSTADREMQSGYTAFAHEVAETAWTQETRDREYDLNPRVCDVPAHHGDTAIGRHAADANLIPAAVNALPALLDEVVRLRQAYKDACTEGDVLLEDVTRLRAENAELRRHVKKMQDVICTEMTQEAQRLGLYESPAPRTEDAK